MLFNKAFISDKEFKIELSKFCGRQPLKILLSPFLNTLSHLFKDVDAESGFFLSNTDNKKHLL